jgi:hypothetical protein
MPSTTIQEIALIIYSVRATFSLYWRSSCRTSEEGETMALMKFIKYDDLSDAEKKELKKVLQEEATAIKKSLAALKKRKTKKAKKR